MININNVVLVGRITKEPEIRKTQSNTSVCQFTLAVNRRFAQEGQQSADFISCVAWSHSADFLGRYCHKGYIVSVEGRIQTRDYTNNSGARVYVTEVIANQVQIITGGQQQNQQAYSETSDPEEDYNPEELYDPAAGNQEKYEEQILSGEDGRNMFGGRASNAGPSIDISSNDLPFY